MLSEMQARSFQGTGEQLWSREAFDELLQSSGTGALVLLEHDEAVGFLMWRQVADEAEILTTAVLPTHRKRGLGYRMLQEFYAQAKVGGVREIFLEVREDNRAATGLYVKSGFEVVGRRKNYYGGKGGKKQDALIMKYSFMLRDCVMEEGRF